MFRTTVVCILSLAVLTLQGCVPVASGVISYESSISAQEHAAYTDYLFAAQGTNRLLEKEGKPPLPIIIEAQWREDIYRPRLEYAHYYTQQVSSNAPIHSFEQWKEIDRPVMLENQKLRSHRPPR